MITPMRRLLPSLLPLAAALAALAAPRPAHAVTFDLAVHIGGGGYLDDGLPFGPGFAAELGLGVAPIPWLSLGAQITVSGLSIERDPPFQVDDPQAGLALYALRAAARVLDHDPFDIWIAAHIGGFRQSITGSDDFTGKIERSVSGLDYGLALDAWWQANTLIALGLRTRYSRLHPTRLCATIGNTEDCRDVTPTEDQPTSHLSLLAGLRLSY